jgi:hypothetical protein
MRIIPFSLGTHCISRSFPLPLQCMLASLATVSVVACPESHAHPITSKQLRNQTPHAYTACCVGVPAVAAIHRQGTLGRLSGVERDSSSLADTCLQSSCLGAG